MRALALPALMVQLACPLAGQEMTDAQLKAIGIESIQIPCAFQEGTHILPAGDYRVQVAQEQINLMWRLKPKGVRGTNLPTEVTDAPGVPKDAEVILRDGWVYLRVWRVRKMYQVRLKQVLVGSAKHLAQPLPPIVTRELAIVEEAHRMVDHFGPRIWPGWRSSASLEFRLRFPDQTLLLLCLPRPVLSEFQEAYGVVVSGKRAYLDFSHRQTTERSALLNISASTDSVELRATLVPARIQNPSEAQVRSANVMRLLLYVHEMFHFQQRQLPLVKGAAGGIGAWKEGLPQPGAMLRAERDEAAYLLQALEAPVPEMPPLLRKAAAARQLKHQAMTLEQARQDAEYTTYEGTATYAALRMADLLTHQKEIVLADCVGDLQSGAQAYLREQLVTLKALAGKSDAAGLKPYLLGGAWCLALERVQPDFREALFTRIGSLDEIITHVMAPPTK